MSTDRGTPTPTPRRFDLSLAGDQQSDQCGRREHHDECSVATRRIHQSDLADQVAGQQGGKTVGQICDDVDGGQQTRAFVVLGQRHDGEDSSLESCSEADTCNSRTDQNQYGRGCFSTDECDGHPEHQGGGSDQHHGPAAEFAEGEYCCRSESCQCCDHDGTDEGAVNVKCVARQCRSE